MLTWLANDKNLLILAAGVYVLAFAAAGIQLLRGQRYARPMAYTTLCVAFVIQFTALSIRGKEIGGCPLGNPMEVIQFLTWSAVFLFLVTFPFYRLNLLGVFIAGFAAILNSISLAVPGWDYAYETRIFGGNPWIELHASLAMFSYGMLGVLALIATMYLIQQRALKTKRSLPFFNFLPSIRELDVVSGRLLVTGVALLSFALGVGIMFGIKNSDAIAMGKLWITTALWLGYIIVFILKIRKAIRPQRFAIALVVLFAGLLISLGPVSGEPKAQHSDMEVFPTDG